MERDGIEPSAYTVQKYRSTKTELTPLKRVKQTEEFAELTLFSL